MSDPIQPGSMIAVDEESTRGPDRIAMAIVVVLIASFLGHVLRFPFVYDDSWTILENPVVTSLWNLTNLLGFRYAAEGVPDAGRPVMLATAMLDVKLWGFVPTGFHLQNLFWHSTTSILLLLALRHVTMSLPMALFGAALFSVHPLGVEPIVVVNYREDLLVGTFMLCALLTLGASRRVPLGRKATLTKALSAFLFCMAALAKESAYVAPLVVLLLDRLPRLGSSTVFEARGLPPGRSARERVGDLCLVSGAVGLAFVWRTFAMGQVGIVSTTAESDNLGLFVHIVEGAFAFMLGFVHFIVLRGRSPEYDPTTIDGFGLFLGVVAVLATIGLAIASIALRRKAPLVSLGLAFALVAYVPTFGLVTITNDRADRYFYFPMMGLVVALIAGLGHASVWINVKLRKQKNAILIAGMPIAWLVSAMLVLGAGALARNQSMVWSNEESLWLFAVKEAPNSPRSWIGWASTLLKQRRTLEAQNAAFMGLRRFDGDPRLREILGLTYLNQGSAESGCNIIKAAGDSGSPYERAQRASNLGYCWMRVGRYEEALPLFDKARHLAPWFERGWTNAAETLKRMGRESEAKELLRQHDVRIDGA
jgi:protein O-mannosyl-transferase